MLHNTLLTAVLLSCATAAAQTCPDQVVRLVPARVELGPVVDCSGVSFEWNGVRLGQHTQGCPLFALITPAHHTTEYRQGSDTYTQPDGRVEQLLVRFTCTASTFLFIRIGATCSHNDQQVLRGVTTYSQFACDRELRTGALPTSG